MEVGLVPIFCLCGIKAMATKAELIQKLVRPLVEALGYRLWGIEYLGQGRHTLLRIYLDKPGGINIDDCAEASRHISSMLDVEDPIKDEYTLEVSSPGFDRLLFEPEQYQLYLNQVVRIRLSQALSGRRNFSGTLMGIDEMNDEWMVKLQVGAELLQLPFTNIEKAQLVGE